MVPSKAETHMVKRSGIVMQTVSDENKTEVFADSGDVYIDEETLNNK